MARNYAKRASDGRRAVNKRGLPTVVYTDGTAALHMVAKDRPALRLVERKLALLPGVLEVGRKSALMGDKFAVTFAGKAGWMTREQINDLLLIAHLAKQKLPKRKTVKAEAPTVLLLPAWCATTKQNTMPAFAAAA